MLTLRVTRHDRNEQLLAECQSDAIPARGEVLQLDTLESDGTMSRSSTVWRIVAVTMHVPSLQSSAPLDGMPLRVRTVEVSVYRTSRYSPPCTRRRNRCCPSPACDAIVGFSRISPIR